MFIGVLRHYGRLEKARDAESSNQRSAEEYRRIVAGEGVHVLDQFAGLAAIERLRNIFDALCQTAYAARADTIAALLQGVGAAIHRLAKRTHIAACLAFCVFGDAFNLLLRLP